MIHRMIRKIFAAILGIVQIGIGALSILLTYILHLDLFDIQTTFRIPLENVPLYVLISLVLGLFSTISGLSFIQEWRSHM